jgi:hypothetical protein
MQNLKEDKIKKSEKVKSKAAVSFFTLQYYGKDLKESLIITCALLGSLGLGVSLPYFALLMGGTINNFSLMMQGVDALSIITELSKTFLYVGTGMVVAGFLMVWLWIYTGQKTVKKIKEDYFILIMRQEQGWFDEVNPYEFATKLKYETQTIENGV